MKKFIIFGDSILKGVMFDENAGSRGKFSLYRGKLSERLVSLGIETENHAKMGMTINECGDFIDRFLPASANNSLEDCAILLEFGGNDSAFNWKEVSEEPGGMHYPSTELAAFREIYGRLISELKARGADIIIANLLPIDPQRYLDNISRGLSRDNILSWLGDVNMLYRWHENYNYTVTDIAGASGLPLLDLRGKFLLSHKFGELICGDGIHPTEAGHKIIEDEIVEYIAGNYREKPLKIA